MGAEAGAGGDAVFIDDAQIAPAHMGRIVVAGEGKAVLGHQPAMVGVAPVGGFADADHRGAPCVNGGLRAVVQPMDVL
jgi:hypothetical protein